jgi:hypothetical protein
MNVGEDTHDVLPEARQHLEQAYIYEEKSEFEKALAKCEIAIQLAPSWAEAHNFRGIILEEMNQGEKAIIAYREAVRLDPTLDEARENLLEAEAELAKEKSLEAEAASTIEKTKRPGIVTAICWFYWLNTLVLGAIGVVSALLMLGPYLSGVRPLSQMSAEMPGILLGCGLSVVIVALAVFFAVVGWGLWRLKRWARGAAMVGGSLAIVLNLVLVVIALAKGGFGIPYGVVFHGLVLWALFRGDVKTAFELISTQ